MVFGESMFSRVKDSSKLALAALCAWCYDHGVTLIDCQQETSHLRSLGAKPLPRNYFLQHLQQALSQKEPWPWNFDKTVLQKYLI
jgi:leucyl/phenylalanyl-tRNA--protein transferase